MRKKPEINQINKPKKKINIENSAKDIRKKVEKALLSEFLPEFLNRIDHIIIFKALSKEKIHGIANLVLKQITAKLLLRNYYLIVESNAIDAVVDQSYNPKYGARPIIRNMSKLVEDPVLIIIANEFVPPFATITINYKNNKFATSWVESRIIANKIVDAPIIVEDSFTSSIIEKDKEIYKSHEAKNILYYTEKYGHIVVNAKHNKLTTYQLRTMFSKNLAKLYEKQKLKYFIDSINSNKT
jgi:hypothetical protein